MKKLIVIGLVVFLFSISCDREEPLFLKIDYEEVPSYVVPIFVKEDAVYMGNAVLIDKEEGLLVTSAHVVANRKKIKTMLSNAWYIVEANTDWIDWHTDLAIVKLKSVDFIELPDPALLGEAVSVGSPVSAIAHVFDYNEKKLKSRLVKGKIRDLNSDWCITLASIAKFLEVRAVQQIGSPIPKEDLSILYKHYIVVEREGQEKFRFGMSGSPICADNGDVVGILAAAITSTGSEALCVPSSEIKTLLEKVKNDVIQ